MIMGHTSAHTINDGEVNFGLLLGYQLSQVTMSL